MKKIFYNIACGIMAFLLIWISASFIDTNLHNDIHDSGYQDYADWNLFADIGSD